MVFSHKMVFIVTVRNYAGTCKGICSYNLVYNFLIQLLPLKSSVFAVHFLNAFWHGNEGFPKGSSQKEVVRLLIIFHLSYCKCRGVKNMIFFVSLSKYKFFTRVALVPFVQHSCRTCVVAVLLVSHSCCTRVACAALLSHSRRLCLALVL